MKGPYMQALQENPLDASTDVTCEHKFFRAVTKAASRLGFNYCGYVIRAPLPVNQPRTEMYSNYPRAWQLRYLEQNYLAIDPVLQHGARSLLPVLWSDRLFAQVGEFREEARACGLKFGWSQSCRDANGVTGVLTLARSRKRLMEAELRDKGLQMIWLAQLTHLKMSALITARLMPEAAVKLSEREVSVLRWVAEGKTSVEISLLLGITERTVNFHVRHCCVKLKAANKTAATIRAALLGFL